MTISFVSCISFILFQDNNVLLERRKITKKTDPGLVTIPGGHVEDNERPQQALVRELKEELGISPISSHFLCTLFHPTNELQLIDYFVVTSWEGDVSPFEAESVFWEELGGSSEVGIEADLMALNELSRLRSVIIKGT